MKTPADHFAPQPPDGKARGRDKDRDKNRDKDRDKDDDRDKGPRK